MAYTVENFKTKKALKEALKEGKKVKVYQPGPFGPNVKDGTAFLEGPHYPAPHAWYAKAEIENGIIIKLS
jgi:hypothetical protein